MSPALHRGRPRRSAPACTRADTWGDTSISRTSMVPVAAHRPIAIGGRRHEPEHESESRRKSSSAAPLRQRSGDRRAARCVRAAAAASAASAKSAACRAKVAHHLG